MTKFLMMLSLFLMVTISINAGDFNVKEVDEKASLPLTKNRAVFDKEVIKNVKEYLETVKPELDGDKIYIINLKVIAYDQENDSKLPFSDIKKYAEDLIAKETFNNLTNAMRIRTFNVFGRAFTDKEFAKEMYNTIKSTPDGYLFNDSGYWATAVGEYSDAYDFYGATKMFPDRMINIAIKNLKDSNKAFNAAKMITEKTYAPNIVLSVLNNVAENLTSDNSISDNDMKKFLQQVNRRYSPKLNEDEETWQPIIASVRTMLETY